MKTLDGFGPNVLAWLKNSVKEHHRAAARIQKRCRARFNYEGPGGPYKEAAEWIADRHEEVRIVWASALADIEDAEKEER